MLTLARAPPSLVVVAEACGRPLAQLGPAAPALPRCDRPLLLAKAVYKLAGMARIRMSANASSVVKEDINPSKSLHGIFYDFLNIFFLRHIRFNEHAARVIAVTVTVTTIKILHDCFTSFRTASTENYKSTFRHE